MKDKINKEINQELNKQGVAEPEQKSLTHGIDWTAIIEAIVEHDGPVKIPEPFTEPWLNDLLEAAVDYACQAQDQERNSYTGLKKQLEQSREGNGKIRGQIRVLEQKLRLSEACERATETKHSEAIKRIDELSGQLKTLSDINTSRIEAIGVALGGLEAISRWAGLQNGWRDHAKSTLGAVKRKLKPEQGPHRSQREAPGPETPPGLYNPHPSIHLCAIKPREETYQGRHAILAKALQELGDKNTTKDSSPGFLINKMIEALRDLRYAYGAGPLWDLIEEEAETICGTACLMAVQAHEQTGGKAE